MKWLDNLKATLIVNPMAGGGTDRLIKKAYNLFVERNVDAELLFTDHKGHAEAIARAVASRAQNSNQGDEGQRIVIAVGGDGTYNEVANGLVHSTVPMGILPMGTTSVLAREIMIPSDIEGAVGTILDGQFIDATLGYIECYNMGEQVKRHFLLMAGVGFDGKTVRAVGATQKRLFGKAAYIMSGIGSFVLFKDSLIRAQAFGCDFIEGQPDSQREDMAALECTNLIVGNGRYYGGAFTVTKDADLRDNSFYCFATKGKGRLNLMKYLLGIVFNRHRGLPDRRYFRCSNIYLEGDAAIQIDGDYIGRLPAHLKTAPRCLRLLVNRAFLGGQ